MDAKFNVSDSTDWLATTVPLLAPLEASLRCQVCKDFFQTPMITNCSHTFCSLCIRRCLANEGKCPTCRTPEQEMRLRRNDTVQELCANFEAARDSLLVAIMRPIAEDIEGLRTPKRKMDDTDFEAEPAVRANPRRAARPFQQNSTTPVLIDDDTGDATFQLDAEMVDCPNCSRQIKFESVNSHLDKCLNGIYSPQPKQVASRNPNLPVTIYPEVRPLPKLTYSLFKETALRKKLIDLGIRSSGPRALMERRHTEWVNLWNANCDSDAANRKPKRELLRELDTWERTQGSSTYASSGAGTDPGLMKKDFDGSGWASNYKDDFKSLIANARERAAASKPKDEQDNATVTVAAPSAEHVSGDMLISSQSTSSEPFS